MKFTLTLLVVSSLFAIEPSTGWADITPQAHFSLGELAGHGSNLLPIDASGNARHFTDHQQGASATLVGGGAHSGSTHHVQTPANTGWWGADLSTMATDNFAFGVWARATNNSAAEVGDVFTTGGGASSNYFRIALTGSGWEATSQGNAWVASTTFTANEWVHLMMLRRNGVAQFFVNGGVIGTSFSGTVEHFNAHLSVNPNFVGGAYTGEIDDIRIATFDAAQSDADVHAYVAFGIPEPSSSLALAGLTLIVLGYRRRIG